MKEIKGIITVLVTPFTQDGTLDVEGLKKNVEFQLSKGIHGFLVNGGTGEYVSMSAEERFLAAKIVVDTVAGELPVMVGASAETTADAINFAKQAEQIGADAIMLAPSYYCQPDWQMKKEHFKTVCSSIKLPVMIYNNGFASGVDTPPDQIIELLNDIPNLIYVKDSTGSIQRSRDIMLYGPEKTHVICGWEDLALESFFVGVEGWISVCSNAAPELCISLYNHAKHGEWDAAWDDYLKMMPYLSFLENEGCLVPATKYANELIGCVGGPNRAPRLELSDSQKASIKRIFEMMELI